jgi:hypothetical protein
MYNSDGGGANEKICSWTCDCFVASTLDLTMENDGVLTASTDSNHSLISSGIGKQLSLFRLTVPGSTISIPNKQNNASPISPYNSAKKVVYARSSSSDDNGGDGGNTASNATPCVNPTKMTTTQNTRAIPFNDSFRLISYFGIGNGGNSLMCWMLA